MKKEVLSAQEYAQGLELVKQLCRLYGGWFVSEEEDDRLCAYTQSSRRNEDDGPTTVKTEPMKEEYTPIKSGETTKKEELPERARELLEKALRSCPEQPTKCTLPNRAWELLEKAREQGWLDEDFRLKDITKTKASLLASAIAYECKIEKKWKLFEDLWGVKHLRKYLVVATYQKNYIEMEHSINKVLGICCPEG